MNDLTIDETIALLVEKIGSEKPDLHEIYMIWNAYRKRWPSMDISFEELQQSILKKHADKSPIDKIIAMGEYMKVLSDSIKKYGRINGRSTTVTNK